MDLFRKYLLSSVAMFSPPDDGGAAPVDGDVVDTGTDAGGDDTGGGAEDTGGGEPDAGGEAPAPKDDHAKPRVESITDSVKRAVSETKEKADAAAKAGKGKTKPQADGAAGDKTAKEGSEATTDGNTATAPQAGSGAPEAWKKEEKAIWDSVPDLAKQAIIRREADTAKGVQALKTRYQELDTAIAPYQAVMTQNNVTPGQAVKQLFDWHMALAGPNKVQAFRDLAKSFGVDPATIAAAPATTEKPAATAENGNEIPENLRPVITSLESRLQAVDGRFKTIEEERAAAMNNAAKQTWMTWSKDKPHAETVRVLMADLINADLAHIQGGRAQVSNTITANGTIDMNAAYEAAIYAHPQVRQTILQEEQVKRDREARAAADKAKKAGASVRSGAPAGKVVTTDNNAPRVESVADSIKRALAEVRGTQH